MPIFTFAEKLIPESCSIKITFFSLQLKYNYIYYINYQYFNNILLDFILNSQIKELDRALKQNILIVYPENVLGNFLKNVNI